MTILDIDTRHGLARAHVHATPDPRGALVLGHGANGSIAAPDLKAATGAATAAGWTVVLVEQPYKVAGRRSAAPAPQLDAAWLDVIEHLRATTTHDRPLVTGGRSSGARVACRTSQEAASIGVLCLAFPVHPPGRPEKSRLDELDGVAVPTLVVQGRSDPFGMPPPAPGRRTIVDVPGGHDLKNGLAAVRDVLPTWLPSLLSP